MKIFITGHNGLVGSALARKFSSHGYEVIVAPREEVDLRDFETTKKFIKGVRPDCVLHAAAVVGGIEANRTQPVRFLLENSKIQQNVIEASFESEVSKLVFFGSNCMYPKAAVQPIQEEQFMSGAFEPTNQAYATAKVSGVTLCQSYRKQYGVDYFSFVPTSLYGPNDNYRYGESHVVPSLIRRMIESKARDESTINMWGSGKPLRELMYSDDLADATLFLLENVSSEKIPELLNIGSGIEIAVRDLVNYIGEQIHYLPEIKFDTSKPDGAMRKALDSSKLNALGWESKISFQEGIARTIEHFQSGKDKRL